MNARDFYTGNIYRLFVEHGYDVTGLLFHCIRLYSCSMFLIVGSRMFQAMLLAERDMWADMRVPLELEVNLQK